jgi:hypothetical protein
MCIKNLKNGLLLSVLLLLAACDNYKPKSIEAGIEAEKMAALLADMHLIEAYIQDVDAEVRDSVRTALYGQVFKIHAVDTAAFRRDYPAYFGESAKADALYQQVNAILQKREMRK